MTRVARFVAFAAVVVGFTACSNPTAPASSKQCNPKAGSACTNVDFVNPNVDFVNPNV
ncbi:MAG: hypothetical protein IT361_16510 [Gemmatimonadaceae bacterium]|nr:hypothetical protein [Gemmatimonadaceae bacterium]